MKTLLVLAATLSTAAASQERTQEQSRTQQPRFEGKSAAKQRPCLNKPEASAFTTLVLPGIIEGLAERCEGTLGTGSFLGSRERSSLILKLRDEGPSSIPMARTAMQKLTRNSMLGLLRDDTIRKMLDDYGPEEGLKSFKTRDCGTVDELVSAFAPLPAAKLSGLIVGLLALTGDSDESGPLICPAP